MAERKGTTVKSYYWLYLPALIFFALGVIGGIYESRKKTRMQLYEDYCNVEERCIRALDSNSISKVSDAINEWQAAFEHAESVLDNVERSSYATNMEDLKCHLSDLEKENWLKKAERHLNDFYECYEIIADGEMENFKDVDQLFKLKGRCISAWQSYFHIDLDQYSTTIYPKRYLREYMGELYDPCMESHDALEKKLSDRIQIMRPEYNRKLRLYDDIMCYVSNMRSILRSELLRTPFTNYTLDEVKCCYRELLKRNRLVEYKLGDRFFVALSDSEQSRRCLHEHKENSASETGDCNNQEYKNARDDSTVDDKAKILYNTVIQRLSDEGAEYIDKTPQGGGLYFFDENIAKELKSKGFEPYFAKNGTKGTGYRPAWYVRYK